MAIHNRVITISIEHEQKLLNSAIVMIMIPIATDREIQEEEHYQVKTISSPESRQSPKHSQFQLDTMYV